MRIVGVNGIATDGERSIDLLLRILHYRGFETDDIKVPVRHWFSARWGGKSDGKTIAANSNDGDIIVAHSFGSLRAWYAHKERDYRAVVCIAPAMSDSAEWWYPSRIYCWHSSKDWAIRLGSQLLFHPFGSAGNVGFSQPGVHNVRTNCGHSDYFGATMIELICTQIEQIAEGPAVVKAGLPVE